MNEVTSCQTVQERNDREALRQTAREIEEERALEALLEEFNEEPSEAAPTKKLSGLDLEARRAREKLDDLRRQNSALASFPVKDISDLPSVDDPLQRLTHLCDELARHRDYFSIRNEYCWVSILLNLIGRLAPAFRPRPKPGKTYDNPVYLAIHRDQIVIDCHWLHATKQPVRIRPLDAEYKPMFRSKDSFPFDVAWEFANENWRADHRVIDMLRLTEFQQCQLAALRSTNVKKAFDQVEIGKRVGEVFIPSPSALFEQGLNAWCERDRRIQKYWDGYVAVWKARAVLGSGATISQVGRLVAMMTGDAQRDDKTIRCKEEKIRRQISGA